MSSMDVEPVGAATATVPWVEKYRPKTVDDVSHQDEVIRTLKSSIASGNVGDQSLGPTDLPFKVS